MYYCYINKININSFNKYDYYPIDINYIKSLKKVVYTALIGKYDDISTINKEKGYDYFIFTDQIFENNILIGQFWILKKILIFQIN